MLVLHYTFVSLEETLAIFKEGHVSSHYTVDGNGVIYQHVDELNAAQHAGLSFWHGYSINMRSIGIEVVHFGDEKLCEQDDWRFTEARCLAGTTWLPFTKASIDKLIALCQDIIRRYDIDAFDVLGHAEIAPQRKVDPGPLFPWLLLAQHGVGVGYDQGLGVLVHGEEVFALVSDGIPASTDVAWFQQKLADWGYEVPQNGQLDAQTRHVLQAFSAHYLGRYDHFMTEEAMMVLQSLITWRNLKHQPKVVVNAPIPVAYR